MNSFDVYFMGKVMEGHDPAQVKEDIGKQFKVFGDKLEHMFSGSAVRVKANVDVTLAGKFREIFRQAGALVEIIPAGEPVELLEKAVAKAESKAPGDNDTDDLYELLPAHSGSLIDCAVPVEAIPIPLTEDFGMAPAGALLPEAKPESPLELDTSHMETVPYHTNLADDAALTQEELLIPDISHLQVNEPNGGNLADELTDEEPQVLPDISHLDAAPANTGTLEDCEEKKEPTPIPDLSNLRISDD